jgi:TatD DNase family protein
MIDTHAHLYAEQFKDDLSEVINRARAVGVTQVLLPNIDLDSIESLNELVEADSLHFKPMMGLHPCSVSTDYQAVLGKILVELERRDCVAVGEIGVDLYWDKSTQKIQEEAFLIQCKWAIEHHLPIVIHSRESIDLIINLLKENFPSNIPGVFHCFTGTVEQANEILEMGMYLGIGGVVTFKNSDLREVLKNVDINRILLETDSPYLAPVPYRGKRNESSYLVEIVKELSKIYAIPEQEVVNITTKNAMELFNL